MRNLLSFICVLLSFNLQAQNVGIGTLTPSAPLHLKGAGAHILRVEGTSPYISLYENTEYRGYLWSRGAISIDLGSAFGTNLPITICITIFPRIQTLILRFIVTVMSV